VKQGKRMHPVRLSTLLVLNYLIVIATRMRLITLCGWLSSLSLQLMRTHLRRQDRVTKKCAHDDLEMDEVVRSFSRNTLRKYGLPENSFDHLSPDEVLMQVEGLCLFHELKSKPVEEREHLFRELESGDDRRMKKVIKGLERSAKARDRAP